MKTQQRKDATKNESTAQIPTPSERQVEIALQRLVRAACREFQARSDGEDDDLQLELLFSEIERSRSVLWARLPEEKRQERRLDCLGDEALCTIEWGELDPEEYLSS